MERFQQFIQTCTYWWLRKNICIDLFDTCQTFVNIFRRFSINCLIYFSRVLNFFETFRYVHQFFLYYLSLFDIIRTSLTHIEFFDTFRLPLTFLIVFETIQYVRLLSIQFHLTVSITYQNIFKFTHQAMCPCTDSLITAQVIVSLLYLQRY